MSDLWGGIAAIGFQGKQLMSEQDPLVIKRLGDSIKIPRDNDWDKVKLQIMQNIVKEKFTQTSHLKRLLIETGEKNLVHATSDRFWGCGHNLYSDDIKNGTWSGKNHMGKILAAVREELNKSV